MPSSVPRIPGVTVVKTFEKAGFELVRIKGSHHILKKEGHKYIINIPVHGKECVKIGLLRSQIADAGMTVDEFLSYLDPKAAKRSKKKAETEAETTSDTTPSGEPTPPETTPPPTPNHPE